MKVSSDSSGGKDTTFLAGGEDFPNPHCRAAKAGAKAKESGKVRAGGRDAVSGPRAAGDGVEHGASRDTEEHG
jgi:hypothetical protein